MLDLSGIDVEEIATALADQTDVEHRWLIDPLPPRVWFQDMADFAEAISDRGASRDLTRSLRGRGAFRRFKNQVYEHHPELISSWAALRDVRARRRAVEWLLDQELVDGSAASEFMSRHPEPDLP